MAHLDTSALPAHFLPSRHRFTSLFTPENYSPKTDKGKAHYRTGIMYFAPARQSGYEVCQHRSAGCSAACLNTSGHGGVGIDTSILITDDANTNTVQKARNARTRFYFENRIAFNDRFVREVEGVERLALRDGKTPCIRPNGTSDLPWERMALNDGRTIMATFPHIQFYDYTKNVYRALKHAAGELPANYHLTFSRSETNWSDCVRVLNAGGNVAVVFGIPRCTRYCVYDIATQECRKPAHRLPESYEGYRVVSGDHDDLRFRDPRGVIIGLTAKGAGSKDTSGFVVQVPARAS